MAESVVPAELIQAYLMAEYRVAAVPAFAFRLRQHSTRLAALLLETGQVSACFITAYNPFSEIRNRADNEAANARLRTILESWTADLWDAAGVDPSGRWPAEPGFLALGVSLATARALGGAFSQNAVVWANKEAIPRLVLLR